MATAEQGTEKLTKRKMVEQLFSGGATTTAEILKLLQERFQTEVSATYVDALLKKVKGESKPARLKKSAPSKAKSPATEVPGTKSEMVKALLAAGITATADVVAQIKSKWGADISPGYVDTLRAKLSKSMVIAKPAKAAKKGARKAPTAALVNSPETTKQLIIALYQSGVMEPAEIVKAMAEKHERTVKVAYVYKILGKHRKAEGTTGKTARGRRPVAVAHDAEFEDKPARGRPRKAIDASINQARGILSKSDARAKILTEALVSTYGEEAIRGLLNAIHARNTAAIGHVA